MRTAARLSLVVLAAGWSVAMAALPPDLLDFSSAGFAGGQRPVPAVYAVSPSGGDDTRAIQAAIEAAGQRPLGADGFRGAVLLRPGTYRVSGQLRLNESGVVLRGKGATLVATGESRRTLIQIGGANDRVLGAAVKVVADAPSGAGRLSVASTEGLRLGQRIVVHRPSTKEWIAALGMTNFPGPGQYKDARLDWVPGSRELEWERTIVAVNAEAHEIALDAPITTALEEKFGGGTVSSVKWPGRVQNVGVEDLDCVSEVDQANPLDEEHAWLCVGVASAENVWVRRVSARRFVCAAVWVSSTARAVTVDSCAFLQPVAEHAAWRRLGFYVGGQQVLVEHCRSENGRHDFAAGHGAAGPNVFLDCVAKDAEFDAGPFESWSSGTLYERVVVTGAGIALTNVGTRTQGAGWTAANSVVWNCSAASKIWIDDPPGAKNQLLVGPESILAEQRKARGYPAEDVAVADANERDAIPAAPPPAEEKPKLVHPLKLEHGYFVVDGRVLFGGSMNSALWKGQLIPGREREVGTSPTRWAPGRSGPSLTEDLPTLAGTMVAQHAAIYWAFPGLWYDRRRDDHSIAIREDAEVWGPFFEPPWRLSGRGRNSMGLSQYDLTRFNPWFFSRLREFADASAERGVVLACQVYDNHNVEEAAAHWADFPWRTLNAVQTTGFPEPPAWEGAQQNRHHIADAFYDPTHAERRKLHELYIRHTLDVLGDSPNVLFTLGYQFAGPLPFQQFFLDTVAAWQTEHRRRVHVALQTSKAVTDAILADPARAALIDVIDLRYWQYLPDGRLFAPDGKGKLAFRELRTEAFGRDAVMRSTPQGVYRQIREYRDRFPDKAIVCGHAGFGIWPVLIAGGAAPVVAEATPGRDGPAHDDAAGLKFVEAALSDVLAAMKPLDDVATNSWCLAAPEKAAWLFYSLEGEAIELAKPLPAAGARSVWFNPRTGETSPAAAAAGARRLAKPTGEAWVLLLRG
jgi:hypothetical protein